MARKHSDAARRSRPRKGKRTTLGASVPSFFFDDPSLEREDAPDSPPPPGRLFPGLDPSAEADDQGLADALGALLNKLGRPVGFDELLRIIGCPRRQKQRVKRGLWRLQNEGKAFSSHKRWSGGALLEEAEGVFSTPRPGRAIVTAMTGRGRREIFIPLESTAGAWPGDRVRVVIPPTTPGGKHALPTGRVAAILSRAKTELAVYARRLLDKGEWLCEAVDPSIQARVLLDVSDLAEEARKGDLLMARLGEALGPGLWRARATALVQREDSPAAQELLVKSKYNVPTLFPEAVLREAAALPPEPSGADFAEREDLRGLPFVTIDGHRARDFDDAVFVEPGARGEGAFRLLVAIADVSHYVPQGGAVDEQALFRGNSRYFPLSVEPMLPEALSNGLCSLKPGLPRLALVADMLFSEGGERLSSSLYPAVIVSRRRLTYEQVERALVQHEAEAEAVLGDSLPMLEQAERLARALLARRRSRGALDFSLPEAEILFDEQGEVSGIAPRRKHIGHRIIEECMIAANECAAQFLRERDSGALYRVHEPPDPDKLAPLIAFLRQNHPELDPFPRPKGGRRGRAVAPTAAHLARLLDLAGGSPLEYMINRLLLRCMMQARYQQTNLGHFALASACYCHFTSPIRRYPDLVVHRRIKAALGLAGYAGKTLSRKDLDAVALHCNECERVAGEAEREMTRRIAALLLLGKRGERFAGVIAGLSDFGILVELPTAMIDGLVPIHSLKDDWYHYVRERFELRGTKSGKVFRLGRAVTVTLRDVSLERQELTLTLSEGRREPRTVQPTP